MDAAVSPNGKFISIATDKDRLIIYSRSSGQLLKNLYGANNDGFSNPRHCWHPSGEVMYATSQTHQIVAWNIRTQTVLCLLDGHSAPIRDLSFNAKHSMLVSTGFDKSVKLWY